MKSKIEQEKTGVRILQLPEPKSFLKLGYERNIIIGVDTKFNKLQKFMWKFLLNIKIEDVE